MITTYSIDIDDYLSESEKKEIAINLFKKELREGFVKNQSEKRIDNYERVINNAIHYFLETEIDSILGTNSKKFIEENVKRVLGKDLSYKVYRNASPWGDKPSKAQIILNNAVEANKHIAEEKVKEALENVDTTNVQDYFVDVMKEVILDKVLVKKD